MPERSLKPCKKIGCGKLTRSGYCTQHKPPPKAEHRLSSQKRGYDSCWRRSRKLYLMEHPWCADYFKEGCCQPATEVDHVIPHKGNMVLFWDEHNWQGLCHRCHSHKTASEDGGFGHGTPPPSNFRKGSAHDHIGSQSCEKCPK